MAVSKYSYEALNNLFKHNTEKYIIEMYKKQIEDLNNEDYLRENRTFGNYVSICLVKNKSIKPTAFTTQLVQTILHDNFNIPKEYVSVKINERTLDSFGYKFIYDCYINIKLDM